MRAAISSCACPHKEACTHTHFDVQTRRYAHAHTHIHNLICKHAIMRTRTHTHTQFDVQTHHYAHAHSQTYTICYVNTPLCTRTHTHTRLLCSGRWPWQPQAALAQSFGHRHREGSVLAGVLIWFWWFCIFHYVATSNDLVRGTSFLWRQHIGRCVDLVLVILHILFCGDL